MAITFSGGLTFSGGARFDASPPPTPLVLLFQTTGTNQQVSVALKGTVNANIDWGDGNTTAVSTAGYANKTYAATGNYTVQISGTVTGLGLANLGNIANGTRLRRVTSWGTTGLTDLSGAFVNCNVIAVPNTLPVSVTNLASTFKFATNFNDANIGNWDVGNVTDTSYMFDTQGVTPAFNQPIGNWNVSKVANMSGMFRSHRSGASSVFNQSLANWNVSNVSNMAFMFDDSRYSNNSLANWDVSNVTDMTGMFRSTTWNGNIINWNTSKVTSMSGMFQADASFNQAIGNWNVGECGNMSSMLLGASAFNQPIGNWNVSKVSNMNSMLSNTLAFNQSIGNWNVSNVTDMGSMFAGAGVFNQSISNWNVSKVTTMYNMFSGSAQDFNQNINTWDVGNVANMSLMFFDNRVYNQPLGNWNTSKVTNMSNMFASATAFNQSIGNWNVSNVTNMANMFSFATVFNQDITTWCVRNILSPPGGFSVSSGLATANIPLWGTCPTLVPSSNITFVGGSSNNAGNIITWPTHQAGDVMVVAGWNSNGSLVTGTGSPTYIDGMGGNNSYLRALYYTASNSSMPAVTLNSASSAIAVVYRGANATTPVSVAPASTVSNAQGTTTTTISYPANPNWFDDSWVICVAAHTQGDGNMQLTPSGLTLRANLVNSGTADVMGIYDSAGLFGKWPTTNVNIGGTNGNFKAVTMRLLPPLA